MPRYYFDLRDGGRSTRDIEGTDLAGLSEMRDEAIGVLPGIADSVLPDGDSHEIVISVRDETDKPVFRATLALTTEWLVPRPVR